MDPHRVPPRGFHRLVRLAAWSLLLLPLAVTSTPPALPPYHEYAVTGNITRTGGGTLEGYAIVLMYGQKGHEGPVRWVRGGTPSLTNASGYFHVRSGQFYDQPVDSLSLAMVNPDTVITGIPFPTSEDPGYANEVLKNGTEDGFFCDKDVSKWIVEGYSHYYDNKILTLP
jgi:hypothetical protein